MNKEFKSLNEVEMKKINGGSAILAITLGIFATGYGMGVQKAINDRRKK
ncbi:hypothetical protein AB6883_00195 [Carnobacterium maltaromaticum]|uniref:Bacteriocin n=1 Tax=Carnobacterium maltaromaticum TaxID=2751 RepID=Q46312_CARML|nr:hypothetical protein [Carnobacterium maltaromaticum]MBR2651819.1 hypothetical protein [bacterium]AAB81302.1 bacteriocin [Carnobacterium maltaromaticum]MBC9810429.1 hypothetical protein [Carnobacterium maltaromaticum]MDT1946588.1 hypothetical protein [Carnobacterium maltaromaticum]MDT2000973.1 hypothetical protein [Carnobacterium maltaromaticum]